MELSIDTKNHNRHMKFVRRSIIIRKIIRVVIASTILIILLGGGGIIFTGATMAPAQQDSAYR
jgi:hypothetical protein